MKTQWSSITKVVSRCKSLELGGKSALMNLNVLKWPSFDVSKGNREWKAENIREAKTV